MEPKPAKKARQMLVLVTDEEREHIRLAAKKLRLRGVATFVRMVALEAADRILADRK